MAEYSGRRGSGGLDVQKRGSRFVSKDCTKIKDHDIQLCNRIGCSGRLSSARSTRNLGLDKAKVLKASSSRCSISGKVMAVKSSNKAAKGANSVKLPSASASASSKGDAGSDVKEAEDETSNHSSPDLINLTESQSGESTPMEIASISKGPNVRHKRTFLKKPASVAGSNLTSSRVSGGSKSSPQLSKSNVSTTRPGSRYLRCSSVPAVAASDSTSISRKQTLKKRSLEDESSASTSSRAAQPTRAENKRTPTSRNGISISEVRPVRRLQTSPTDDASALVRARRALFPPHRSPNGSARDQRVQRLPYSLSTTSRPHRAHNCTHPNMPENSHTRISTSPSEVPSSTSLLDHENFRRYNINGIAEVLLALDQIEHDQEISIEQLLALESNLFLNAYNFHDQHRDMRLDIDGMSYEELLALEERIGSVSTALSEEALAKSINKSTYNPKSSDASFSNKNETEDDTKCSICQEEYDNGDEMGSLKCKHSYHLNCIDQWLRQKNWCPICKSSAATETCK